MGAEPRYLAVPNFSEGSSAAKLGVISASLGGHGAERLDLHLDRDHNRAVFTLAGTESQLVEGIFAAAASAIGQIDMRAYVGLHPAVGALDVCPIVALDGPALSAARLIARRLGARLGDELGLPVLLYGALASDPAHRERHFFRDGGLRRLSERLWAGELVPDFGPRSPHPTAGVTLLTARKPLAAFNFELNRADLDLARTAAAALRESGGGPIGVRAIGLLLSSGRAQVSTNIHDPIAVPIATVLARLEAILAPLGGRVIEAELVGLLPLGSELGWPHQRISIRGYDPDRSLIEARLADSG